MEDDEILEMLEDLLPDDVEIHDWQLTVLRNMLIGACERGMELAQRGVLANPYGRYR